MSSRELKRFSHWYNLLNMPVYLAGTIFRTFLNAAQTFCLLLDVICSTFTSRSISIPRAFDIITVNALKLLTFSIVDAKM